MTSVRLRTFSLVAVSFANSSVFSLLLRRGVLRRLPAGKGRCQFVTSEGRSGKSRTKNGASEGIRTLDTHVGNVMLYQAELRSRPINILKLEESNGNASLV
jgi:hypothetical protein